MKDIMLNILNNEAKKGNGKVIKDYKQKLYILYDEHGNNVYSSVSATDIGSWLDFHNKFNIPYSEKPKNQKRRGLHGKV